MSLFNWYRRRTPKRFSYTPRHYRGSGNPYEIKHKFDEYRTTVDMPRGIKAKFIRAFNDPFYKGEKIVRIRLAAIIIVLVLIALYILDFDIGIFFK